MKYIYQFQDQAEKQSIIDNNKDKILIEEQNLKYPIEQNFLIFTDTPGIEDQVKQLKEDNLILMDVLATLYEDMLAKGTV